MAERQTIEAHNIRIGTGKLFCTFHLFIEKCGHESLINIKQNKHSSLICGLIAFLEYFN